MDNRLHYRTMGMVLLPLKPSRRSHQPSHQTLSWLESALTVSYFPLKFLLRLIWLPLSVWIPFLEIGWTVFTFSLAGAKTYQQMLALRFVVGLFEAGYWPALYYILGSWYNKRKWSCLIIKVFDRKHCWLLDSQANLESATVFCSLQYQSHQSSVDSCKLEFTMASTVMLVLQDGDGFLVSFLSTVRSSHFKISDLKLQSSTVSFLSQSLSSPTSSCLIPLGPLNLTGSSLHV